MSTIPLPEGPVPEGLLRGLNRVEEHDIHCELDAVSYVGELIDKSVDKLDEPLSYRFVALFSELSAVAAASRIEYDEARLTLTEVSEFLSVAVNFFNSWRHDVGG